MDNTSNAAPISTYELEDSSATKELMNEFLSEWKTANDTINQETSGSTGTPKRIKISKSKMERSAQLTGAFFQLDKCKSSLLCINPNYIGGKMMIVRSLYYNLTLTIAPTTANPIKTLNHTIDFAAMVPLQVATILNETPEKLDLIKYLIIGGAPVSKELEDKLQSCSCQAYATFGMTETVSHIALKDLKEKNAPFVALGNTWFETETEQLVIHAPDLGIDSLKTNDCVQLLSPKSFNWLGRADFVINSGGIKFHPERIEKKISSYLNASNFIAVGVPDEKLGEKLILVTEQSKTPSSTTLEKLETVLTRYELPKEIVNLDQLMYTPAGKIDRNATREKVLTIINNTQP